MNETMRAILHRRAIRKYRAEQIPDACLEQILEAGLWAPSAGGQQSVHLLVSQDAAANESLGRINRNLFPRIGKGGHDVNPKQLSIAEDSSLPSGFYGAPTVVMLFTPADGGYSAHNAMAVAENMMIAASSLDVGSAFVGRAKESMETDEGRAVMRRTGIPEGWHCHGFVLLGYGEGEAGDGSPRRRGRIHRIQ